MITEDRPPMQHYQPFNSAYDAMVRHGVPAI